MASQVDQLVQNGVLVAEDINDKVQAELRTLSTELMYQIASEVSREGNSIISLIVLRCDQTWCTPSGFLHKFSPA